MRSGASLLTFKQSTILMLSILSVAVCLWPIRGVAQEVTATINGTITDPSGSVVANAEVIATDLDRGTVWPTKTNQQGFYNLTRLPVGRYSVRVSAPGFRTALHPPIELQLNQTSVVNAQLVVGQNSETVQVTSEAPLLQTETTEVGTVIDERANVNLPLASRNYLQLTLLTPGAVTPNPAGGYATGKTTGENDRPMINGNRFTANDYVLDGMDNNQMSDNFVAFSPQPDAIQEFNLISQNAPADFGNYMGGIISVATKAGTNAFHGSVFEFFRNDVLNANEWQNGLVYPANPKAKLRWNQYGGAVGGPIIKNKLFFFADYQAERFDRPVTTTAFSVFTAKERTGDFSELTNAITDPLTGLPFPGNVIPQNRLSPAAVAIVTSKYYPTPQFSGLKDNTNNVSGSYVNLDQGDGRLDWAVNDKNHVFGRFSKSRTVNPTTNSDLLAYGNHSNAGATNSVVDYTRALTPNLLNDARFGVGYITIDSSANANAANASAFGIAGLPSSILPAMTFRNSNVTGPGGSGAAFGSKDSRTTYADTVIQYQDVLNWTHGKHNSRFGFQGWRLRMNGFFSGNGGIAGNLDFNGRYSGQAESDFMLGLPDKVAVGRPGPVWGQRGNIFGAFYQDDWKLTSKLTLNLGLRYEDHTPWYETQNKEVNFDPYTGNLELPGQNGNSRALYNSYNGISNFQPRIGISYSPFAKTVIRAGYAVSAFMEGTGQGLRLPQNPPYQYNTSADYNSLALPKTTLDQGFTSITTTNPCTLQGLQTQSADCYGTGPLLLSWDKNVQPARSSQWNLTVQHQLTSTMTFQIGYVGQTARHLDVPKNLAQLYLNPNTGLVEPSKFFVDNSILIDTNGPFGALPLATFSSATSNYNALQASLQGRLNHGMSYQLSYTWSHCLTDATGFFGEPGGQQSAGQDAWYQNVYDPHADYGSCYFNVKQNFTGYFIYDLPFGRGRTYGADSNPVVNAIAGGWRLSVIPTFRGGFPITLGANDSSGTVYSFGPRPDCNAPPVVYGKSQFLTAANGGPGYQWFSTAPYSQPASGFGTCSVSSVYGPGERNIDMGLSKEFQVHETQNLEFRAEFLNAFNHPILNAPNNNLGPGLGLINSSQGARNIQFALKYNF
jgi:hypothetical protein